MRKNKVLTYRGVTVRDGDLWVAMSLEFGLAAQAHSELDARNKLRAQVRDYVTEAYTIDKAHQTSLLNRRASNYVYFLYYFEALKGFFVPKNKRHLFLQEEKHIGSYA